MIPTRALVLLAFPPLALAAGAVAWPALWVPMVAWDVVLLGVALIDLALARGAVGATRQVQKVQAVGRSFPVTLTLENLGTRALSLQATDDAPGPTEGLPGAAELAPATAVDLRYRCQVDQRGPHPFGPITVRWTSPLGLWQRQRRIEATDLLRVYPDFAQLRGYGLDTRTAAQQVPVRALRRPGGENEFQRLRPYVPGDPYRHIDWKATARRREFVTREYGQERNQNVLFLLDCGRMMSAASGALTLFDHALNASMMLGQTALRHGDRVGLLAFDHQVRAWLPPRGGSRTGSRLIRGTYDLFPTLDEPDYAQAFRYLGQRVRRRSLVVLLTTVADAVNAELATAVVSAMARRHLVLTVWLRDTELYELLHRPPASPQDSWTRAAAAELLHGRERALDTLRQRGALVVDAPPGQLTPQLLARYLEIKARRLL